MPLTTIPDLRLEAPPVGERVFRAIGHAFFPLAGMYGAYVDLPSSLIMAMGPIQLIVWVLFMATGAVASVAALRGRYLHEYVALPFMLGGAAIYAVAMADVVASGLSPGSGIGMLLISALSSYIIARWVSISRRLRNPLKLLFRRKGSNG